MSSNRFARRAAVGATRFSFDASAEPTGRAAPGQSAFGRAPGDPLGRVWATQQGLTVK